MSLLSLAWPPADQRPWGQIYGEGPCCKPSSTVQAPESEMVIRTEGDPGPLGHVVSLYVLDALREDNFKIWGENFKQLE